MTTTLAKRPPRAPLTSGHPLALLRHEMDDLISRIWDGEQESWFSGAFVPSVDVIESANAYEVRMDIPGMQTKDIDVQVHGNTVTLRGERKEEKEERGKTYHRIERRTGSFARTLTLPCEVNEDEVAAEYTQGAGSLGRDVLDRHRDRLPRRRADQRGIWIGGERGPGRGQPG